MDLQTARLRLRPLEIGDAEAYGRLLADPRVHPFVLDDGPLDNDDLPERVARKVDQWRARTGATWSVLHDGDFVGYVALHGLGKPKVAISYAIAPDAQRQGFGVEAVRAALRCGDTLGFVEVEARTHLHNEGSAALLRRAGFEEHAPVEAPARRVFRWRSTRATAVAHRLAAALDRADWDRVRALLHRDCVYTCRGSTIVGPKAIADSYASVETWVRKTFEDVQYESHVAERSETQALITFRDRMALGVHRLDFRCQQRIDVDDTGRIVAIEHIDLPGEREKADAFNRACGVVRP